LWEVPSGRPIGAFHGHADFVQAVAFAPDGRELASVGLEGTMKVWDRRRSLPVVFEGHTGAVSRLWYRRDGRRVVTAPTGYYYAGKTTKGWDPSTGELDPTLTGIEPGDLGDEFSPPSFPIGVPPRPATSPDGKQIARPLTGAGGLTVQDRSKTYGRSSVLVLDTTTDRVSHTLIGHTADVVGIAFSPDGRRIATASYDRTIKLWDTATGREVFTLRGHTAGLFVLAFSPDGHRIVSGGIDNSARVWDATPLPAGVLQAQDAQHRRQREALKGLATATEDVQRAQKLALDARWDLAAAAFGKLVAQAPDNPALRYSHIRCLLAAGDVAGVRRACEDLLKRRADASFYFHAYGIAWSCVLAPDAVSDHEAPIRLAEAALAGYPERGKERSDLLNTLGAALYRAGRFDDAIRRLNQSIQASEDEGDPRAFAFLAMVHHRLDHADQAKRWLDKLVAYQPKPGAELSWDDVDVRILRREAESLILGSTFAIPPTAPAAPAKRASGGPAGKAE
jgi:hypothetical protein